MEEPNFTEMGGAGQLDSTVASRANTALYSTFSIVGFCAGTFLNYCIYSASFYSYNHTKNQGFVTFSGALLGVCAAFLWCAQGTVMMAYPSENKKGRYIGIFWAIFNLGAVIGSCIPMANQWHTQKTVNVNDGTYIGFMVLMAFGGILAWFLVPPEKIVRKDGSRVQQIRHPSAISELKGLYQTLILDPWIILLFPFFFASNYFYTYQLSSYNLYMFNTRTRSFTGLFYWLSQILGSLSFGWFLDISFLTRRSRAILGWLFLFLIVNSVWGGGLSAELLLHRPPSGTSEQNFAKFNPVIDIYETERGFVGYFWLFVFYGFMDACWQTYAYWLMGAMSNDPRRLAYFAGFYKGIQSAGGAVAWGIDMGKIEIRGLYISSWALCGAGLLCAVPVVWKRVRDTEMEEEEKEEQGELAEVKA
ncbi:Similar to UNC93-like protein C922.05c; acc. no. Q9URX1 [Pyronema omphalodes CBS 100304]|uniref:Similar to UNC93-like protein C922.05c acc. no. Q9URX1 n=1 Tax=Pyronema omphalodes (strain CBS 100304) TaxID=1076935 RepID=U4LEY5_PYROM|nr:Similar to UNC93-like protein C922.05c; acc. no. Q9URX1 [Pyronema omphalodes CBS 100304]